MQQNRILPNGINADFGQWLRLKTDTVAAAEKLRIGDRLQKLVDQHPAILPDRQSRINK